MFLSARNESSESEDIQELISSSLKCNASTPADDMESGRGGAGAAGSTSSSPSAPMVLPFQQKAGYRREEDPGRCSCSDSFFGKYFTFLVLMFVTASLVILPLVLPPLPPPPSMLMLVPVAMLVMLLALAFMPTSGGRGATSPTAYL
ncbi:hypothetical protein D1007_55669 [Hordeum vulgare]|uniref:Uncharacterized protein n=2 Tax=Hordeum vulgare subsp. vulgare TaxID=112509 RepID=M0UF72_HORVV|nr:protein AUXIN-REGULATED GENE INVOLVED IN ORGAN SIZE-like [Hordeum vulgare subsp. vulgare]KAE8772352.1 hypothetical protein D1007_55669 [Hordeum vulgare]KAI5015053.1 hypothetical protein ZWY2020_056443 [Hordeum vulgare]